MAGSAGAVAILAAVTILVLCLGGTLIAEHRMTGAAARPSRAADSV